MSSNDEWSHVEHFDEPRSHVLSKDCWCNPVVDNPSDPLLEGGK